MTMDVRPGAGGEDVPPALGLGLLVDAPSAASIRELLREVVDPELGLDIVELGLLRGVEVTAGVARVRFTVTTPACPLSGYLEDEIRACLWQVPSLVEPVIELEFEPPWRAEDMSEAAREALGWSR